MDHQAHVFNLARRLSVRNENDLLQEDMMSDSTTQTTPTYNRKVCMSMLDQVCYPDSPLPYECEQYQDVKLALQRKNSNKHNHAVAFQGMNPGEAAAAMAARERGHLHHAQIQRRLSSNAKKYPTIW